MLPTPTEAASRAGITLNAGLLAEVTPVFLRLCEQGEEVAAAVRALGLPGGEDRR